MINHFVPTTLKEALKILKEESGSKWDPDVINALFEVINQEK